jgi:hypothetical protein
MQKEESQTKKAGIGVTYIFGAGASAGLIRKHESGSEYGRKMPLVSNFEKYFVDFRELLIRNLAKENISIRVLNDEYVLTDTSVNEGNGPEILEKELSPDERLKFKLVNEIDKYVIQTPQRFSIDTIAKAKWFEDPTSSEYLKLKKLISLVIWCYQGKIGLDPRYEAFLASILKKEENQVVFPSNVNIISWNYDLQFEEALNTISRSTFLEMFDSAENRDSNYMKLVQGDKLKYFKLNGIAGGEFKHPKLDSLSQGEPYFFISELQKFRTNQESLLANNLNFEIKDFFNDQTKSSIKFAWELDRMELETNLKKMNASNILVVIGYSFPAFNRKNDYSILNGHNKYDEIYVQCGDRENNEAVKERVNALLDYKSVIQPINNTSEFYIPNNLLLD